MVYKSKGLELGAEPPRIKPVESHPLPRWDCASFLETMLNLLFKELSFLAIFTLVESV